MAYVQEYLDFVNEAIRLEFYEATGLSMIELGNQRIISGASEGTAKQYFTNVGMQHTSVDINGLDGALPLDLRVPELFYNFSSMFDVLTNLGVTEHVEPIDRQYECFSVIHDVVKPGGVIIHMVPDLEELEMSGAWAKHCSIYYRKEFFLELARNCNYTILENKVIFGLRSVVFRKESSAPFLANELVFSYVKSI